MLKTLEKQRYLVSLDNREIKSWKRNERAEKLRAIVISGILSIILLAIILITLPMTG